MSSCSLEVLCSGLLERTKMETCSERRKRKLIALAAEKGGLKTLAADCGLSHAALDQVIKGVLLPEKGDGTRREKALGDDAARAIEAAYKLGRGWLDADDTPPAVITKEPTLEQALELLSAALQDVDKSTRIAAAPLLAAMASDPAEAKNQSELLLHLLVADRDKSHKSPQDGKRQSRIFENLGVLDLGDANGRSNTDTAAEGRKK